MQIGVWLGVFATLCAFSTVVPTAVYKRCSADVNNLWIDIVLVIDNSKITNMDGVYSTIKAMFGPSVRIGSSHKKEPRTTRVAIVTYSDEANVVADFDKFQSLEALNTELDKLNKTKKTESFNAFLDLGLQTANQLITHSNNQGVRNAYQKLIVVFTSNYAYQDSRPDVLAQTIRESGVHISTVYTGVITDGNTAGLLSFVGNYNLNFHMADTVPIAQELQNATALVNCFCPTAWYQYEWPRNTDNFYAICVLSMQATGYQQEGMTSCHKQKGGYLATEFDKNRRSWNYRLMNVNGSWVWDQPKGMPLLPLDPSSGTVPATSGCIADVKFSDGSIAWTSVSCGNRFPYLCEMAACDTDNYCL